MQNAHKAALDALSIARAKLAKSLPYYTTASEALRPVAHEGLGTLAVTADGVCLYDPAVVVGDRFGPHLPGVWLHELLHPYLRHHKRGEAVRRRVGVAFDAYLWNLSADFEVNRIVRATGLTLPDGVAYAEAHGLDPEITAEAAYEALTQQQGDDAEGEGQGDQGDQGDQAPGTRRQGPGRPGTRHKKPRPMDHGPGCAGRNGRAA